MLLQFTSTLLLSKKRKTDRNKKENKVLSAHQEPGTLHINSWNYHTEENKTEGFIIHLETRF